MRNHTLSPHSPHKDIWTQPEFAPSTAQVSASSTRDSEEMSPLIAQKIPDEVLPHTLHQAQSIPPSLSPTTLSFGSADSALCVWQAPHECPHTTGSSVPSVAASRHRFVALAAPLP